MVNDEETTGPAKLDKTRLVSVALEIGAVLVVAFALLAVIGWLIVISRQDAMPNIGEFLLAITLVLGGFVSGLALWGLAAIVRKLEALQQNTARSAPPPPEAMNDRSRPAMPTPATGDAQAMYELTTLTREIRDISLLDEQGRAERLEVQRRELGRRLEHEVPALLREHKWVEARLRVQDARERFPGFTQWDTLETQIEEVRAAVEVRDVEAASRQINDLASLGAWDRTMDVVRDLLERHPDSVKANELAQRVARERDKAVAEQRARMMNAAQAAADQRNWVEALDAANKLIQKYPKSPEADALRVQLDTLRANAEIQTRQQMESDIRDLIKEHRYDEALRIARELVSRYPDSPQAHVLYDQLPRLEEKAAAMGHTI